jgi:outer membrane receptor protein involved in Fe transport
VRYRPTERLITDIGLRWDQQTLEPERTATLSPRLGVRYRVGGNTFLRASLGRFNQSQSIDELQIEDGVDRFYRPEESDQFVAGIEQLLPGGSTLRLEAYEKRMRRLRPRFENLLDPLSLAPELTADRIEIAPSEANARGVEVSFTHDVNAALKWRVAYSRSSVQDRIGAEDVYRSWDQEDALAAGLEWESAKWNVNVQLVQRSGWPTTPVTLNTTAAVPIATVGPRNSERMAAFRSVDVRLERRLQPRRGSAYVFFEASNLFNRANACCTDFSLTGSGSGAALDLARVNYLPLVPSVGFVRAF